jgi:SAM-dependent methyltransferase
VFATDPSEAQVRNANRDPRVHYAVTTAESSALGNDCADLVTVAQALHWFDLPRFYAEAGRILKAGGVLAVWRYGLATVDPAIDAIVERFYSGAVGPYWPPERAIVEGGYGDLALPFAELAVPPFTMEAQWSLAQLAGYLGTWSAVTRFRAATGADPIPDLVRTLALEWGDAATSRQVRWPLEVRATRK